MILTYDDRGYLPNKGLISYRKHIKRGVDLLIATLLVVLMLPMGLVVCLVLFLTNRGSVLFTQLRPGQGEKLFKIYKFKTMSDEKDEHGILLDDAARMTRLGKLLRATSLDELPQLWNVLIGDMSIIGPRPFLPEYLPLYSEAHRQRHLVKPGITGWAQVHGRNELDWQDRLDRDLYYAQNLSLKLDLQILFKTIVYVITMKGITSPGSATMEKFTGYN